MIVVTTVTSWNEPPRIRHQVTRQLTRFYNVLYVELPYAAQAVSEELVSAGAALQILRLRQLSWLERKLWANVGYWHAAINRQLVGRIEHAVRACGYQRAVLVNFQFDFPEVMRAHMFKRRIYVCNDEFQAEKQRPWTRSIRKRGELRVIAAADMCLAVSVPLLEKLRRHSAHAELFLPGHEFTIAGCSDGAFVRREGVRRIGVCYMGFLNTRLRFDWFAELARAADIELTLVGPVEAGVRIAELMSRDNVRHITHLAGDELQAQLASADVLVMPYDVRQDVVRAITAPNKLFQYLATGRPVVCANLPRLLSLPPKFLYVAADAQEFVQAVRRAYEEDNAHLTELRLQYAAGNTWNIRGERLDRIVRGVVST